MQHKDFLERYLRGYADLPPAWQREVQSILLGYDSQYSADKRGVTRDAVKAQRKKIFKQLKVDDGRQLILAMFQIAVSNLK